MLSLPMKQEADGTFSAEAPLPPTPGRYFVEIIGTELPPDKAVQKGWRVSLVWLPLHAGVAEPNAPDDFIRRPKKNHPDPATWSSEIFNAFNFDNVEIGSANMTYGPGTVLSNGVLVSQDPPATFGQIHDANGNYLTNSTLRSAPFQVQLGVRFQF